MVFFGVFLRFHFDLERDFSGKSLRSLCWFLRHHVGAVPGVGAGGVSEGQNESLYQ